jgi:hypothetical protein
MEEGDHGLIKILPWQFDRRDVETREEARSGKLTSEIPSRHEADTNLD